MKVVVSGGGTGGHIYPALTIAKQFQQYDAKTELLYIGSAKGLESAIVPRENLPFRAIEVTGFKRSLSLHNARTIWNFVQGVRNCKQWFRDFKPDVVVGTGGYVCGPVIYAASKLGIPTLIHEQNVIPGLTNSFLSRYANVVAVSFKGSEKHFTKAKKAIYTGNPRASEVAEADASGIRARLQLPHDAPIVVIVGGSRGALVLNQLMIAVAEQAHRLPEVQFVYITGQPYFENTRQMIEQKLDHWPENIHIYPYMDQMPELLAATSLIISRSGASFIAEITALGIPSIQIPSPNVTNNHQEANARWLADAGAAELVLEKEMDPLDVFARIERIIQDPIRHESMSNQSKKLGQPDAAKCILEQLIQLMERS